MLGPDETELQGQWTKVEGKIIADSVCDRIAARVSDHLIGIGERRSGWKTLFQDPVDGRFWERVHSQSELHGGGPPTLRVIDALKAHRDYEF